MLWLKTSGAAERTMSIASVSAVEVGGQHLDRRAGPGADGQDAAAEVVGAAVGEVVAGHRRDDDVLQAEPVQASARRSGSSRATASGLPRLTAQKPQGRVQVSPRTMNVAVRRVQHSERFGHLPLSQIVSRPSSATSSFVK